MPWLFEGRRESQLPIDRVWAAYTDVSRWAEWTDEIVHASLDGPLRTGTLGRVRYRRAPPVPFTVTLVSAPHSLRAAPVCNRGSSAPATPLVRPPVGDGRNGDPHRRGSHLRWPGWGPWSASSVAARPKRNGPRPSTRCCSSPRSRSRRADHSRESKGWTEVANREPADTPGRPACRAATERQVRGERSALRPQLRACRSAELCRVRSLTFGARRFQRSDLGLVWCGSDGDGQGSESS